VWKELPKRRREEMSQAYELLPILGIVILLLVTGGILYRRRALQREKAQLLADIKQWRSSRGKILPFPPDGKFRKRSPIRKLVSHSK
jgi:hypothetical protein